jgi:class 3 adenylate cyclase
MTELPMTGLRFLSLEPPGGGALRLVVSPGTAEQQRIPFCKVLEIGRDEPDREPVPGLLLVPDLAVSRRHCVLTCSPDGRCFVRDVSRNGTRVAGRRLVPNVESEIHPGETLSLAGGHDFVLEAREVAGQVEEPYPRGTVEMPARTIATVLVGDIRDYTTLVRRAPSAQLQRSVSRVFETLAAAVVERGGTVKEYPGDAIVAFWEGGSHGIQAVAACRAALELDIIAHRIAGDATVWQVDGFPLNMEWALATGPVIIDSFGGSHPQGLSVVGEPIVLAFRLEKIAGESVGRILACHMTRAMAGPAFRFHDLGEMTAKGFDRLDHVYALEALADDPLTTVSIPIAGGLRPEEH